MRALVSGEAPVFVKGVEAVAAGWAPEVQEFNRAEGGAAKLAMGEGALPAGETGRERFSAAVTGFFDL